MADIRAGWVVYDGDGDGPGPVVVREFVLHQGNGKRMDPKSDETKPEAAPEPTITWAQALAAVEKATRQAFDVGLTAVKEAHKEEIGRIEARFLKEKTDEVNRINAEHERQIEALHAQFAVHVATQTAGTEAALHELDGGHHVFHESNEAIHTEIVAALTEENEKLRKQLKRR